MLLAVESSCDESAIALFDPSKGIVNEWVHSQIDLHKLYGGVVPDLASREHLKNFSALMEAAELKSYDAGAITQVAVTNGPGLAGCLALGMTFARSLAFVWKCPVVGVNHLRGHAFSPFMSLHGEAPDAFRERFQDLLPHLGLIVSGGNSLLFTIERCGALKIVADTVDDAAGEALDKGAKLLGLPYPGGPLVEKLAASGNVDAYDFPKAIAPRNERRFSFSGLKTSLRYQLEKMSDAEVESALPDICAAYQQAVIDQLIGKSKHIIQAGAFKSLGLSGGVSNNKALRSAFARLADRYRLPAYFAQPKHTGDNAAMIAFAAFVDPQAVATEPFAVEPSLLLA